VSSGNRYESSAGDSAPKCFRSPGDRNPEIARTDDLRMISRHGGGYDQFARAIDMIGAVSRCDRNSERLEILDRVRVCVATRYGHTATSQQLGEGAHPRAGDPDEMDWA
jgi:hypothetical protein